MGILSRAKDIVESNINALLDKAENPSKMADQILVNLRKDLAQTRKETAVVIADEKEAKRKLDENQEQIDRYTAAAQAALKAGNEGDAREIIAKKQSYETSRESLQKAYDVVHGKATELKKIHDKLVNDISLAESRCDAVKAMDAASKAQKHANKVMSGTSKSEATMSKLDAMEAKANKALVAATAEAELIDGGDSTDNLVDKYTSGVGSVSVDDELEKMKAELGL